MTRHGTRRTGRTRLRRAAAAIALLAALGGCSRVTGGGDEFGGPPTSPGIRPEAAADRAIRARDLRAHIAYLSEDAMRGRATPSRELDRAAAWIAARFREAGLEPAGEAGGYIHFWPYDDGVHAPNVVGLLPGADVARSGEYVILVAHFDHLGVGEPSATGDSVYNGADDNASGTAALIAIGRAFGALGERPARPVLFLATSGGEDGHRGAGAFVREPTVFLTGAVAVLALDMVARNHPDTVAVVGHGFSELGPLLDRVAARVDGDVVIRPDPAPAAERFAAGDHYAFARAGIPAVLVTTLGHDDHHRPSDEVRRVDAEKAARIARLIFHAAHELATSGAEPAWTAAGRAARGSAPDREPDGG